MTAHMLGCLGQRLLLLLVWSQLWATSQCWCTGLHKPKQGPRGCLQQQQQQQAGVVLDWWALAAHLEKAAQQQQQVVAA
jgi:hypothetical protein